MNHPQSQEDSNAFLRDIVASLMLSENFGDVHDVINAICRQLNIELGGNFIDGWTEDDYMKVGIAGNEEKL